MDTTQKNSLKMDHKPKDVWAKALNFYDKTQEKIAMTLGLLEI